MTGPEHYHLAEEILTIVTDDIHEDRQDVALLLAEAQVHATLALAAATEAAREGSVSPPDPWDVGPVLPS